MPRAVDIEILESSARSATTLEALLAAVREIRTLVDAQAKEKAHIAALYKASADALLTDSVPVEVDRAILERALDGCLASPAPEKASPSPTLPTDPEFWKGIAQGFPDQVDDLKRLTTDRNLDHLSYSGDPRAKGGKWIPSHAKGKWVDVARAVLPSRWDCGNDAHRKAFMAHPSVKSLPTARRKREVWYSVCKIMKD